MFSKDIELSFSENDQSEKLSKYFLYTVKNAQPVQGS